LTVSGAGLTFGGIGGPGEDLGPSLVSRRKRLMAAWSSTIEPNAPRLRRHLLSFAKKPSTALSQKAEVGVHGSRMTIEPGPCLGMLMRPVIVEDHVDDSADWNLGLDGVQEADKFLVPVALHAAPDDFAFEHVESGEQGGGRCVDALTLWP
jgi:hypothetical protein